MKRLLITLAILIAAASHAQTTTNKPVSPTPVATVPVSGCPNGYMVYKTTATEGHWQCTGGNYVALTSSVSAGVTSIAVAPALGMTSTGGPITTSGTITL